MSSSPRTPGTPESSRGALERIATNGSVELPLLTKANYHEWALVMQVALEALELWDAVESMCKERARDRRALAAILRAVPADMKAGLAVKKSAKEAWDAVKSMRVGDDRVKAASVQRLWKEFENFRFRDGECVDDVAVRINGLVASLREMGETLEDHRVVKKLLRVVPRKFKQVAVAIEMLTDLKKVTIEELVGRLRVAEDADKEDVQEVAKQGVGRLLLMEEQWEARWRQKKKERARSDWQRGGNDDRRRNGGNSGGGDHDDGSDVDDGSSSVASDSSRRRGRRNRGRCYECGETGHIARWCRERKKKEEVALLGDAGDSPTLL